MLSRKMSVGLLFIGMFYATIACGDTYRCVNSKGLLEFTDRPCAADGSLASTPAIPRAPKVESGSISNRSDGALCPMHLASQPQPSGVRDWRAKELDHLEAKLYTEARSGSITWLQLVDNFYTKCAELHPGYRDENGRELPAYQRALAEQMDNRQITESQWVYLQEQKLADMRARNQIILNSRQRPINCEIYQGGMNRPQLDCY